MSERYIIYLLGGKTMESLGQFKYLEMVPRDSYYNFPELCTNLIHAKKVLKNIC